MRTYIGTPEVQLTARAKNVKITLGMIRHDLLKPNWSVIFLSKTQGLSLETLAPGPRGNWGGMY